MQDSTKLICIFLTLIACDWLVYRYVDGKVNVVPFNTLDDEDVCNESRTNDILRRANFDSKTLAILKRISHDYGTFSVSTTPKSNDDIFLDSEIRLRYPIGVVEGDAILLSDIEIKANNICSKYSAFAVNWNNTGRRHLLCLKGFENQTSSAFSLKSLDAHVTGFLYKAVCVTKDWQLVVSDYYIGYRLCGRVRDNDHHLTAMKCSKKHKQSIGCFYKGKEGRTCQKLTKYDCRRTHRTDGGDNKTKVCTVDGSSFNSLCEALSMANLKSSPAVAVVKQKKPCPERKYKDILAPALYVIENGQQCTKSTLEEAPLVLHYYVHGFRENDIISLCYVCHDADYAIYTVTEIINDTVNTKIHYCSPVDSAKTFYVSLYNKTLTMKEFDENSLSRIFFEDYHKEYMTEFTFVYFAGMDIVMSSNPAPTPNQYELRCAFKKYKDIKVHSNAFYGLQIRSNNPVEIIVGSMKKPSSIFGIAEVPGQYTCYANGYYSGAYAPHDPIFVIETTHTVIPAPIGKWGGLIEEKNITAEIISYTLICIIAGVIIIALVVFCFFQYKRRAVRRRIEYLTGQSGRQPRGGNESLERMTLSCDLQKSNASRYRSRMKNKSRGNIANANDSVTKTKISRINDKKSSLKTQSSLMVAVASSTNRPKTKYTSKRSKGKLKQTKTCSKSKSLRLTLPPKESL